MNYVSSPLTMPLMWLTVAAVWLNVLLYKSSLGKLASWCVDRYGIRPTTIDASLIAIQGITYIAFLFAMPSPVILIHLAFGLLGPIVLALAAEAYRTPANKQVRPPWYVGEGKPEWQPPPPSDPLRPSLFSNIRFSVFSAVVFLSAICAAFAIGAPRWKSFRRMESKRIAVENRIQELGGKVSQRTISLAWTNATDEDLKLVSSLDGIKHLSLSGTKITNEGIRQYPNLDQLRALDVDATSIDDSVLEDLRKAKKLEMLNLRKTSVTGEGLRPEWTELKQLDLSKCPVTRKGIERISELPDLVAIYFQGSQSIDDSMIEDLATLRTKVLDLSGTNVSREGFEKLKSLASDIENIWWHESPPMPPALRNQSRNPKFFDQQGQN